MLRLFRKMKYGDSSKEPIYIKSKDKWLYKNKWISNYEAIDILTGKELRYSYTIGANYYTTNSFSEVLVAAAKNPLDIDLVIPSEFSIQELEAITAIRAKKATVFTRKFQKQIEELQDQVKKIQDFRF
mgnify:CR=1 FL=1